MRNGILKKFSITAALLFLFASFSFSQTPLNIGGPAPKPEPSRWLKGSPVTDYKKGMVYVFEFWATWCGPCIEAMPHLSELAKQYKGKISFVGVNVWEKDLESSPMNKLVDNFMNNGKGNTMEYSVCQDGQAANFDRNWLKPGGVNGIPSSFVINQDGNLVWIGDPRSIDKVLEQVLAGTFDYKLFAEQFEKQRAAQNGTAAVFAPIQTEYDAGHWEMAVNLADRAISDGNRGEKFARVRMMALAHFNESKALDELKTSIKAGGDDYQKKHPTYLLMASVAVQDGLSKEAYQYFSDMMLNALKENPYPQENHGINTYMAAFCRVNYYLGNKEKAIQVAEERLKAPALASTPGWRQMFLDEIKLCQGTTNIVSKMKL